jgi:biopolymer transport protein ExbB/TolQ
MNANTLVGAFGVIAFLFSCISLGWLFYTRGQSSGRVIEAIRQAGENQRDMNALLRAQAEALKHFGEGMEMHGKAMHEVAQGFRDFAREQADTNKEIWLAIQTSSKRINDLMDHCPECKYEPPGG